MTAFKPYVTGEGESQLRQWLAYTFEQSSTGVAKTGVLAGLGCTPTSPSPSGSVVIGKGAAICQPSSQAFPLVEPADETFDVFTDNPMQFVTNPRNDVIVLDQVTGLVTNLVGEPNAIPSSGEQSVPATAVPLWRLRHAANATTIPASVMDDLRVSVSFAGAPGPWVDFTPTLYHQTTTTPVAIGTDVTYGRWRRIDAKTVQAQAAVARQAGTTTTGGLSVALPVAGTLRNLNCGTLAITGSTAPSAQSSIAVMTPDRTKIVVTDFAGNYLNADPLAGVRFNVTYEG
jgi:hypothetical protein